MSARIEYAPGEAWGIVTRTCIVVCERDLGAHAARELHTVLLDADGVDAALRVVRAHPLALVVAGVDAAGWSIARRFGVPAATEAGPLADRMSEEWASDALAPGTAVRFGAIHGAPAPLLPIVGGIVRLAAMALTVDDVRAEDAPRGIAADAERAEPVAPADSVESVDSVDSGELSEPITQPEPQLEHAFAPASPVDEDTVDPADEPRAPEHTEQREPTEQPGQPEQPNQPEQPEQPEQSEQSEHTRPHEATIVPAQPTLPIQADSGGPLGGLIDSVPGFIRPASIVHGTEAPRAAPEPTVPEPTDPEPTDLEPAGQPAPQPEPAAEAREQLGDHDGMTISAAHARRIAAERHAARPASPTEQGEPATGPLVLSTLCVHRHVNAPAATACSTCDAQIQPESSGQRNRPEFAVVVLPSGERVPAGRGVVIGRRPRSRRIEDGRVPRLVSVESPGEDISRSHLEVRCDDWNIVAVDLSSTNGTVLLRDGQAPQRLRPESPTIVAIGDRLDLGDGVVVCIEAFA